MLLAVDIGNTNVVLGLFDGDCLKFQRRLDSQTRRTEDEWLLLLRTLFQNENHTIDEITGVAISSVVPSLTPFFRILSKEHLKIDPLIITGELDLGITIHVEDPYSLGADRLCNAIAGYDKYGGPLVILDFGTATTYDVIAKNGDYIGGIIAPGLETAARHLHILAAKLPSVELIIPNKIIATTTEKSMQVGIMYSTIAAVNGLIDKIQEELQEKCTVIATGGIATLLYERIKVIDAYDPNLTLNGIKIIYSKVMK